MRNLFWRIAAKLLARDWAVDRLFMLAIRRPYFHLYKGATPYMLRYWLLNPYERGSYRRNRSWWPWSIRIHVILKPDSDRHPHNHPWNARTVILQGWYIEERVVGGELVQFRREAGDTVLLSGSDYHRIIEVCPDGAVTMFISGEKLSSWGFLVANAYRHYRWYLELTDDERAALPEWNAKFGPVNPDHADGPTFCWDHCDRYPNGTQSCRNAPECRRQSDEVSELELIARFNLEER